MEKNIEKYAFLKKSGKQFISKNYVKENVILCFDSSLKFALFFIHLFFDKSKLKIGRQCIHNRISSIFARVNFNWYNYDLGSHQIRVGLKK